MTKTQTRQNIAAAVARRTELAQVAQTAKPRQRKAAYAALEQAEMDVDFAVRAHEMAVRASMPGATEAEIQSAARAA